MRSHRGIVQAVVALVYLALLSGGMRLLMLSRLEAQRVGDVAHARLMIVVVAALGVVIAAFTIWARRNAVAAAVAVALLTVPVVAAGPFQLFGTPRWLRDAWWALGFAGNATIPPLAWGAAVAALAAALFARRRTGSRRPTFARA